MQIKKDFGLNIWWLGIRHNKMKGKNTTKDVNVFPDELAFACFFCKCNLQQRVVHTAHTVNPFKEMKYGP